MTAWLASIAVFLFLIPLHSAARRGPVKETDLAYVTSGSPQQQLDLYLPDSKGFPTILFVHGGSLTSEDRKDAPYPMIGEAFQKAGLGCAVINYRLGPENRWPAQPEDVVAALAWLKKNIAARGGDPGKIFLVGHSSGALLVALVSSDEKYLKKFGLSLKDIAGCVPMGSMLKHELNVTYMVGTSPERVKQAFERQAYLQIFGSPEVFNDASPYRHISKQAPPFLILVAEAERYEPPILSQAEEFVAAAKQAGASAEVEVLKDRTHRTTINKMTEPDDPTLSRILRFVGQVKKK